VISAVVMAIPWTCGWFHRANTTALKFSADCHPALQSVFVKKKLEKEKKQKLKP